jgi:mRNA interferase RelE/StbE
MPYQVKLTRRAENVFAALPREARIRIAIALERYAANLFHRHDVKKVRGCPPETPRYRIRISEYRATFRIIRDQLVICVVRCPKKEEF